jgi:malonate decarboxylase beta subunit
VIEQEAGIAEYDSRDKPFIWSFSGGEQRAAIGLADRYVADDVPAMARTVRELCKAGVPSRHRDERVDDFLKMLQGIDNSSQPDAARVREIFAKGVQA